MNKFRNEQKQLMSHLIYNVTSISVLGKPQCKTRWCKQAGLLGHSVQDV